MSARCSVVLAGNIVLALGKLEGMWRGSIVLAVSVVLALESLESVPSNQARCSVVLGDSIVLVAPLRDPSNEYIVRHPIFTDVVFLLWATDAPRSHRRLSRAFVAAAASTSKCSKCLRHHQYVPVPPSVRACATISTCAIATICTCQCHHLYVPVPPSVRASALSVSMRVTTSPTERCQRCHILPARAPLSQRRHQQVLQRLLFYSPALHSVVPAAASHWASTERPSTISVQATVRLRLALLEGACQQIRLFAISCEPSVIRQQTSLYTRFINL